MSTAQPAHGTQSTCTQHSAQQQHDTRIFQAPMEHSTIDYILGDKQTKNLERTEIIECSQIIMNSK